MATAVLKRLYQQYRKNGNFSFSDFLQYREEAGLHQKEIKAALLCLHGTIELDFICWKLNIKRPNPATHLGFFVSEGGVIRTVFDPVDFLENFSSSDTDKAQFYCLDVNKQALEKATEAWLAQIIHVCEQCHKRNFLAEKERLTTYYEEIYKELNQKRDNLYLHNYFFEKEKQLMDEFSMVEDEIKANEYILAQKYKLEIELNCLFLGGVRQA